MSVRIITEENYEQTVGGHGGAVILDFQAEHCAPCVKVSSVIEGISDERPDILACSVDVGSQPGLAARFGVMSIPTVVILKGGKAVGRASGFKSREQILALIDRE
jgi:thioredoxin 1